MEKWKKIRFLFILGIFCMNLCLFPPSIIFGVAQSGNYAEGPDFLDFWELGPDYSLASPTCCVIDDDYAYIGVEGSNADGLWILDVSDPTDFSLVGNVLNNETSKGAQSIVKAGDFVYLGASSLIFIFNVADPTLPTLVGKITVGSTTYGLTVDDAGEYLYVAAFSYSLNIFDLSIPSSPVLIWGKVQNPNYNNRWTYDVTVRGDYAYCADSYGLRIYNISDPTITESVGILEKSGGGTSWSIALFGTDKIILGQATGVIDLMDVSDPIAPDYVTDYIAVTSDIYKVDTYGNTLFAADYTDGFVSLDLSGNNFQYGKKMNTESARGDWVSIDNNGNYIYFCGSMGFYSYDLDECIPEEASSSTDDTTDGLLDNLLEIPGFKLEILGLLCIASIGLIYRKENEERRKT